MKMKMVTALFVLSLGTTASFAQTGASDGSRFGHGEDSIRSVSYTHLTLPTNSRV